MRFLQPVRRRRDIVGEAAARGEDGVLSNSGRRASRRCRTARTRRPRPRSRWLRRLDARPPPRGPRRRCRRRARRAPAAAIRSTGDGGGLASPRRSRGRRLPAAREGGVRRLARPLRLFAGAAPQNLVLRRIETRRERKARLPPTTRGDEGRPRARGGAQRARASPWPRADPPRGRRRGGARAAGGLRRVALMGESQGACVAADAAVTHRGPGASPASTAVRPCVRTRRRLQRRARSRRSSDSTPSGAGDRCIGRLARDAIGGSSSTPGTAASTSTSSASRTHSQRSAAEDAEARDGAQGLGRPRRGAAAAAGEARAAPAADEVAGVGRRRHRRGQAERGRARRRIARLDHRCRASIAGRAIGRR